MATTALEIEGLEVWEKRLGTDVRPLLRAGGMALMADLQADIAPYPPAPARGARSWYERGFGPRWRTKDGKVRGSKRSQNLGRRWALRPTPDGAELVNTARYAKIVHGTKKDRQAGIHARRGWRSVATAIGKVERSGDLTLRIMEPVIAALGGTTS